MLLAACNSILGIPEATPAPGVVQGTAVDVYWQADTHTMLPRDLSGLRFAALVPNSQSFDVYPGVGAADGTFAIPGVPDGVTFYLEIVQPDPLPALYTVGRARVFDLGGDVLGRPDVVRTTQTTNLVLDIANLQSYQDSDYLELLCINNGGSVFDFGHIAGEPNAPKLDDIALNGTMFDWSQPYGPGSTRNALVDAQRGDLVSVLQESTTSLVSGVSLQILSRVYSESFDQIDGAPHTLTGTFTAPPPSLMLNPTIKRSMFEAHRAEINPATRAQNDGDYFYGDSLLPSPDGHPQYAYTLDLFLSSLLAGTTDVAYGTFAYPDPFPSAWEHLRLFSFTAGVKFAVDNAAMTSLNRRWQSNRNLDFAGATIVDTVQPTLSPVTAPTVDGADAFVGGTFSSVTPLALAWQPGAGTIGRYIIEVVRAYNDVGKTQFATVGILYTLDTHITVPVGLVTTGNHYIFVVSAQSGVGSVETEVVPMISGVWTAM